MNKQPVLNILRDIFQAYGYEVGSSNISDMVASKGPENRIYIKLDGEVDYNAIRGFAGSIKNTDGRGLYILNNTASGEVYNFVTKHGLILWDRHEMQNQIGKAILANAAGEAMNLELEKSVEYRKTRGLNEPQQPQESSIFGLFNQAEPSQISPESRFSWPGIDTPLKEYGGSKSARTAVAAPDDRILRIPLPSLPINMAKTSAVKLGESKIGEVKEFILKFIPYYDFRYDFVTKRKFRSKMIDLDGNGEGSVNGITGELSLNRFPDPSEYVEIPTDNYQIKEPQVTDKEALDIAVEHIISKHTQKLKVNEVKGDAIISESKTLSPVRSEINVSSHLVYVPVWEIQGMRNSIELNAYDGHIMAEPVDEDAEFVV